MNYLEKAMDLDIHLASEYPECKRLTDHLFHEISEKLNQVQALLKKTYENISTKIPININMKSSCPKCGIKLDPVDAINCIKCGNSLSL